MIAVGAVAVLAAGVVATDVTATPVKAAAAVRDDLRSGALSAGR